MLDTKARKIRSFRSEREFGLIVGGIFLLLGLWWIYRGKFHSASEIILTLGGALVVLGLVFPRGLVWPNKTWMGLAEILSFVSTRVILAVVFFGIVTPIGFIKRLFGWDPLNRRAPGRETYWQPYSDRQKNPRHYEKMF
jgi:hypothetical protein